MKLMSKTKYRSLPHRYGCDLSEMDFPDDVERGLKKLGLGTRFLSVPKRKRGLTSSGIKSECHRNVALLTKTFGGKHVKGFSCSWKTGSGPTIVYKFIFHSVWVTPEGKAVCPTWMPERDVLPFIPVLEVSTRKDMHGEDFLLTSSTRSMGMCLTVGWGDVTRTTDEFVPFSRMKPSTIMEGYVFDPKLDASILIEGSKDYASAGGFTKPSMGTGRFLTNMKEAA